MGIGIIATNIYSCVFENDSKCANILAGRIIKEKNNIVIVQNWNENCSKHLIINNSSEITKIEKMINKRVVVEGTISNGTWWTGSIIVAEIQLEGK